MARHEAVASSVSKLVMHRIPAFIARDPGLAGQSRDPQCRTMKIRKRLIRDNPKLERAISCVDACVKRWTTRTVRRNSINEQIPHPCG